MRGLWHVLEVAAIYALKRLIGWFFTTKNKKAAPAVLEHCRGKILAGT